MCIIIVLVELCFLVNNNTIAYIVLTVSLLVRYIKCMKQTDTSYQVLSQKQRKKNDAIWNFESEA